jgi:hypothetical protein
VKDGKPAYCYNFCSLSNYVVAALERLTPGPHTIVLDFAYDGGGVGKGGKAILLVDGRNVGETRVAQTASYRLSLDETFDIGEDTGTSASEDYEVPFPFSDQLNQVTITLKSVPLGDQASVAKAARQGRVEKGLRD